ncbi:hypothetical protein Tco_0398311 [Tanacetum coccineum]
MTAGMLCLGLLAYIHCHIALLSTVEILAHLLGLRSTYELANIIVDVFEYHFQFLMAASVEAQISLIKLEFSSCLFADSPINLLKSILLFLGWPFASAAVLVGTTLLSPRSVRCWNIQPIVEQNTSCISVK